jgi:hypothetical protein
MLLTHDLVWQAVLAAAAWRDERGERGERGERNRGAR